MADPRGGFDWGDYFALASELAARADDEAATRSAISRSYYAAFGRSLALLRDKGRTTFAANAHAAVWRAFSGSPDRRRAEIAAMLMRLR